MSMRPKPGGFAFQVCMHLAANPDALVSSSSAREQFGGMGHKASDALRPFVRTGWLSVHRGAGSAANEYTAGPEILKLHGRES